MQKNCINDIGPFIVCEMKISQRDPESQKGRSIDMKSTRQSKAVIFLFAYFYRDKEHGPLPPDLQPDTFK